MKNIIFKTLGFISVGIMAAGCVHETFPEGSVQTSAQIAQSSAALKGMLNGLPASMNTTNTMGFYKRYGEHTDFGIGTIHLKTEYMLNDLATLGDNPYYNRFYSECLNQVQGDQFTPCSYYWEAYYTWIKIANDVISVVDPETASAEELKFLGQALAYRAMFYLDLARLYEPKQVTDPYAVGKGYQVPEHLLGLTVPIVTPELSEKDATTNPRATREELYNFILTDLEAAAGYLKDIPFDYKEPSLAAVNGLRARAYLEMGYWEDANSAEYFKNAADYARKVIDESGRTPLTEDQWHDPVNGFNNGAANSSWIWGQTSSSENLGNIICYTAHISSEASWGYAQMAHIGADRKFYDSISEKDWRKKSWLSPEFMEDPENPKFKDMYKFAGSAENRRNFLYGNIQLQISPALAYQNIKFRPASGECSDFYIGNATDMCLMRIEEMYFIEAEAVAKGGDLNTAKRLLQNFIKTRNPEFASNVNTVETFLIDDLLHQKRIEFWGEGILFYDYKRLNAGIERGYAGTNQASVYRMNCQGRSPQWNIVISRLETQANQGIPDSKNNPDPSEKIELWTE